MATEGQRQFVSDIESAVAAAKTKGSNYGIGEICELAGRTATDLRAFTLRMHQNGDWDLVQRLDAAFRSLDLYPAVVTHAMQDKNKPAEPLTLKRSIPVEPKVETRSEPKLGGLEMDTAEVMGKVIKLLAPMRDIARHRVINSVSVYYGVGE